MPIWHRGVGHRPAGRTPREFGRRSALDPSYPLGWSEATRPNRCKNVFDILIRVGDFIDLMRSGAGGCILFTLIYSQQSSTTRETPDEATEFEVDAAGSGDGGRCVVPDPAAPGGSDREHEEGR